MPEISQAWLALIGALLGGTGLKFIEHRLNNKARKDSAAADFRRELREEVKHLRSEVHIVETEVSRWREKYYAVQEELIEMKRGDAPPSIRERLAVSVEN